MSQKEPRRRSRLHPHGTSRKLKDRTHNKSRGPWKGRLTDYIEVMEKASRPGEGLFFHKPGSENRRKR